MTPYSMALNNPAMYFDPNGMWVKGGGFWNNLFNSDEKVIQKMAHKHAEDIGGVVTDTEGGFLVSKVGTGNRERNEIGEMYLKGFYLDRLSGKDPVTSYASDNKESLINTAQILQDVGDATAVAGYGGALVGAGVAGVGAAPGLAVAGAGEFTSLLGSGLEILTYGLTGQLGESGKEGAWVGGGIILDALLDKAIPGPTPDMSREITNTLETGNELLKQGGRLKLTGAERLSERKE